MSDAYTFTTLAGAHVDENNDSVCDLCRDGEKPSIFDNVINSVVGNGEEGGLLESILANPLILGGGGGGILLLAVILIVFRRIKG